MSYTGIADRLIVYRSFDKDGIISLIENEHINEAVYRLINFADEYGFEGDILRVYLSYCIANDDNAYARQCELEGRRETSTDSLVLNDLGLIKDLYDDKFGCELRSHFKELKCYKGKDVFSQKINVLLKAGIEELSEKLFLSDTVYEFRDGLGEFYKKYGYGKFAFNKAFCVRNIKEKAEILPVKLVDNISFSDIIGYDTQKEKLIENTRAFLQNKGANNTLLFGDAGTGKSSCIKALSNLFFENGLRIVEVSKHRFSLLPEVLEDLSKRNYKFIIYMDDLSFEDNEVEYKYLKAILEGGISKKPDNVLIYATSNRRHLIRESFKDKADTDEELHRRDTVQEKLSLAARFGLNIYFSSPDKKNYDIIVEKLANRANINMPKEALLLEANKWELGHGGRSGRAAAQFIKALQGSLNLGEWDDQ